MPEVDYAVLSEWFDWITTNISIPVDLIGENTQSRNTNTQISLVVFSAFIETLGTQLNDTMEID